MEVLEYQEEWSPVNTDEFEHAVCEARRRVLKIQTKLHRWAYTPTGLVESPVH